MSTAFTRCSLPRLTACLLGPLAAAALATDGDMPSGGSASGKVWGGLRATAGF